MDSPPIETACVSLLSSIAAVPANIERSAVRVRGTRIIVDGFVRELSSLDLCLTAMKEEQFSFPACLQHQLVAVIRNWMTALSNMALMLAKRNSRRMSEKVKWFQEDRDQIASLCYRLRAHKLPLETILELASLTTVTAVEGNTSVVMEDTETLKAGLLALRLRYIAPICRGPGRDRSMFQAAGIQARGSLRAMRGI